MSEEVVFTGRIGTTVSMLGAWPVVAIGAGLEITVDLAAKAVNKIAEMKAAADLAREELEKKEAEAKCLILAEIESSILNLTAKNKQRTDLRVAEIESHTAQIRAEVMRSLAGSKFETVDFHKEIPQADEVVAEAPQTAHTKEKLMELYARLEFLDQPEAGKIFPLVRDIDSDLPGRIDAVAIQLKLLISRAVENLAKDIWYRHELAAMIEAMRENGASGALADELKLRMDAHQHIDKFIFEDLIKFCHESQYKRTLAELSPLLSAGEAVGLEGLEIKLTPELFTAAVMGLLKEKGYELYDENGQNISDTAMRGFAGLDLGPDYQAMLKVSSEGLVSLRLVRMVADEKELWTATEYQKQKDHEAAQKWCAYCQDLKNWLDSLGLLENFQIKRDEKEELLVMVNRNLAVKQKRRFEAAVPGNRVFQAE